MMYRVVYVKSVALLHGLLDGCMGKILKFNLLGAIFKMPGC